MKQILNIKLWIDSLKVFFMLTLITGVIFPAFILLFAQCAFPDKAEGSLLRNSTGTTIGSSLIAQKFEQDRYFWPRPSAADYASVPSGASNLGPTSESLRQKTKERSSLVVKSNSMHLEHGAPPELLLASGSGLDPHLSPAGIQFQLKRVSQSRKFNTDQINKLNELILSLTEEPQVGLWGPPRVNVLLLNIRLDEIE